MVSFTKPSSSRSFASQTKKPTLTLICPAYNEGLIIESSVSKLCNYLATIEEKADWDILIINDGSSDNTAMLADQLSSENEKINVIHHRINRNLGAALKTGFKYATGDYVLVLDLDLSYSPDHIEQLLDTIIDNDADIVIASPYMKGGKTTAVPSIRLFLSKSANRIMKWTSGKDIHTFTGMVRIYRGNFLKYLNLKSSTFSVQPEIIYKAILLRAKIMEIPAHLDWSFQKERVGRVSSAKLFKGTLLGLMSSFIFKPYGFFMAIGLLLFSVALYVTGWIFVNTFLAMPDIASDSLYTQFNAAVAQTYNDRPYSFIVAGTVLIVSFQFLSAGFLSLQSKRYFEELFHLNTSINKTTKGIDD